jgi:hypothetical protein
MKIVGITIRTGKKRVLIIIATIGVDVRVLSMQALSPKVIDSSYSRRRSRRGSR